MTSLVIDCPISETVSRVPTFGDFVTETSMQDVTVARLQSTRVETPLPPPLNVMYCVRVSLWTVKIFCISLCECLSRKRRRERRDQVRLSRVQLRLIIHSQHKIIAILFFLLLSIV